MEHEGVIIPIEAKAGVNLKAKSLHVFANAYQSPFVVRTSMAPWARSSSVVDLPLYALGGWSHLLSE